jgi:hypothetical protein
LRRLLLPRFAHIRENTLYSSSFAQAVVAGLKADLQVVLSTNRAAFVCFSPCLGIFGSSGLLENAGCQFSEGLLKHNVMSAFGGGF